MRVLLGFVLLLLGLLVLFAQFTTTAQLFEHGRELFRGFHGDGFHLALKDEEVLGFGNDAHVLQFFGVFSGGDLSAVDTVLGGIADDQALKAFFVFGTVAGPIAFDREEYQGDGGSCAHRLVDGRAMNEFLNKQEEA